MNIFIAKLSSATTSEDLQGLFEEYGEVTSAKVIFDKETGRSKRFGFVEMSDEEAGTKAINELDECTFDNSKIVVKKARPKTDAPRGGERGFSQQNRW